MEQVGSHVISDATTHQFNCAVERLSLAVVPHHVEVAGASGLLEVEAEMAGLILNRIKFESRLSHVTANGAIATGIHHQALDRSVGTQSQIHPAVLHLHGAGQHQPCAHRAAEHHGGQKRKAMPLSCLAQGLGRRYRDEPNPSLRGCCSHQPIGHVLVQALGNVVIGSRTPSRSRIRWQSHPLNSSGSCVTTINT